MTLPSRGRLTLILLAYAAFVSLGLPDGLLGVAWPSIQGTFGVRLDALGLLLAASVLGYLVSSAGSGRILRVMNVGTLLGLSVVATSFALFGFALAPSFWTLLPLATLLGFGGGAIDAGLNTFVATHFSSRTLNWLHAAFGVGTTLGPLVMTAVLAAGEVWRWGYVAVATAQAALALAFLLTRRRWVLDAAEGGAPAERQASSRETLRRRGVALGVLTFFVYTGVEVTAGQWTYSVLTLSRGFPEATAGLWVSLYWGSLTIGRIVFGIIVDRWPLVPLLRGCFALAVLGSGLFALDGGMAVTALGLVMIGFALAPIFPSLISLTPRWIGRSHAANAIGFQVAAAGVGAAALPAAAGLLARATTLEAIGLSLVVMSVVLFALFEWTRSRAALRERE